MPAHHRLSQTFLQSLNLPADTDATKLTYRSTKTWDSVGHMRLVAAIETAFNIMLTTDEILDMSSFEKACEIVKKHGVQSGSEK